MDGGRRPKCHKPLAKSKTLSVRSSELQKMKKKSIKPVNIYITEPDYQRLNGLIEITRERNEITENT